MSRMLKRILIAEDSNEWQKFHAELLKNYNNVKLDFTIASNAKDALKLIEDNLKNPYDLIITDLQMETDFLPEFAGEWLISQIKKFDEYKRVPIVIVSATYNIAFIAHSRGTDYLSKRSLVSNPSSYYFLLDEKLL